MKEVFIESDKDDLEEIKKGNLPISRLVPNIVTILALCFGLTSIRVALQGKWEYAVICILISCVLDGLDGRLARMLKATSSFGAQLDSLSDFVNFGICPPIIIYLWNLHTMPNKNLAWGAVLFYAICCAIRLARFNVNIESDDEEQIRIGKIFFIGIPSPTAALLALTPLMMFFEFEYRISPYLNSLALAIVGFLMASRIPTFSGKKLAIKRKNAWLFMLFFGVVISILIFEPWASIPFILGIYIMTIPFSIIFYFRLKKTPNLP